MFHLRRSFRQPWCLNSCRSLNPVNQFGHFDESLRGCALEPHCLALNSGPVINSRVSWASYITHLRLCAVTSSVGKRGKVVISQVNAHEGLRRLAHLRAQSVSWCRCVILTVTVTLSGGATHLCGEVCERRLYVLPPPQALHVQETPPCTRRAFCPYRAHHRFGDPGAFAKPGHWLLMFCFENLMKAVEFLLIDTPPHTHTHISHML